MAEGQTYNIPEAGFEWFRDKMKKLGKRAEKLVGEKLFLTVVGFHFEGEGREKRKIMEVFVACPNPMLNGWEFVARIDHSNETGNIVRTVGKRQLPESYRTNEPVCDHCGYKRRRRDTFVVYSADENKYLQVGRGCLKDFLGHGDADKYAKLADLISSIGELVGGAGMYKGNLYDRRWVDVEEYCQAAAMAVLDKGWVSRRRAEEQGLTSTSSRAWDNYHDAHFADNVTPEARDLAEKALEWARGLGELGRPLDDYEFKCNVIANGEAIEPRNCGIAASIVGVYYMKNVVPLRPKAAPKGVAYYGKVNDKITHEVVLETVSEGANSYRHVMYDDAGHLFIWFASNTNLYDLKGKRIRISATIKGQQEYMGKKQNLVNRVKVLDVIS